MAANSVMEFLERNYCQTTTQFVVNSNTDTVSNILNPDRSIQFYSDGFANDSTTVTMRINFDATVSVSRIALLETNLKSFTIFYNGATANTFSLTTTGSTVTSNFSSNSETSLYLRAAAVNCTSVSIDMKSTQVANSEKAIGHLIISDTLLTFARNPNSNNYSPKVDPEQVVHQMSDGGVRIHTVQRKFSAEIKLRYISTAFRNSLKDIYLRRTPFVFCPFGTTTGWDEFVFECVWPGNFDFYTYSEDAANSGFSGTIALRETTT